MPKKTPEGYGFILNTGRVGKAPEGSGVSWEIRPRASQAQRPQNPQRNTAPQPRPQNPQRNTAPQPRTQGQQGYTAPQLRPQGQQGYTAPQLRPQNPQRNTAHQQRPQNPQRSTAPQPRPQGQQGYTVPQPRPQNPQRNTAPQQRPQNPQRSAAPQQRPQNPQRNTAPQPRTQGQQGYTAPQLSPQNPQRNTAPQPRPQNSQGYTAPSQIPGGTPFLTERQRILYEQAYYKKYGKLPYVKRGDPAQAPPVPRQDRRQTISYKQREEVLREEAERRRREAERLEAEAAAARRAAEREDRRRREAERRLEIQRREEENLRRYRAERQRLAEERRKREEEERRAEAERIERIRRRRRVKRVIKYHTGIFIASLVLFLCIGALIGYGLFYRDSSDSSRSVTYYFDGERAFRSDKSAAYCDGNLCVDFTSLADHFGFYSAGDKDKIKFVIPDSGTNEEAGSIEFIIGSSCAVVNGTPVSLSVPARYIGSSLWVSAEALSLFDKGMDVRTSAGKVEVSRINVLNEDGDKIKDENGDFVFEAVGLYYEEQIEPSKVDLVKLYGEAAKGLGKGSAVSFSTDLTGYEDYMNPIDSNEYLVLVNSANPLDVTYLPGDLEDVADTRRDGRATARLRQYAARSLEALFIELRAAGYADVSVTSGFVSYNEQAYLFNTAVNTEMTNNNLTEEEARTAVHAYLDEAGCADSQAGLTAVLHDLDDASPAFENQPAYAWLAENAWKFGFVERYPKGKEAVTGHSFDPCSYRYVGRFAAEIIHRNGWCLEEYLLNSAN